MSYFHKNLIFYSLIVVFVGLAFAAQATRQDCVNYGTQLSGGALTDWNCYSSPGNNLVCLDGNSCGGGQTCCRFADCSTINGGGWSCTNASQCSGQVAPLHCSGGNTNVCCGPALTTTNPTPTQTQTTAATSPTVNPNTVCGTAILDGSLLAALNAPNQMSLSLFTVLIYNVVVLILCIVGALTLLMIVYGGITMLISGGSSKNVEKGKKIITDAIIGLVIVLTAYILVHFVIDTVLGATTVFNK